MGSQTRYTYSDQARLVAFHCDANLEGAGFSAGLAAVDTICQSNCLTVPPDPKAQIVRRRVKRVKYTCAVKGGK